MAREIGCRVALRGGIDGEIRMVRPADAPALLEAWIAMATDGRGMVADVEEMTMERVERSIARYLEGERSGDEGVFLVGVVGGRAVADASVRRLDARRVRHVGVLGVGVHPEHQGIGLGRAMMRAAIDWAQEVGIERLELAVRGDNDRAIRMYESLGFARESVRPRFVKLPDGTYVDDLVMVRTLG